METAGPASRVVGQRIAHFRGVLGLSVRDLAGRLDRLGHRLLASGVTKVEKGQRGVDVDDLVAFALALGVPPIALLIDPQSRDTMLTPGLVTPTPDVIEWMQALGDLPRGPESSGWWPPGAWGAGAAPFRGLAALSANRDRWEGASGTLDRALRAEAPAGQVNALLELTRESVRDYLATADRLASQGVQRPPLDAAAVRWAAANGLPVPDSMRDLLDDQEA